MIGLLQHRRGLSLFLAVSLCISLLALPCMGTAAATGKFDKRNTYASGQFIDVGDSAWYAGNVRTVYELGLMKGKSAGRFDPDGNVTIAEPVTIAARMHAIYYGRREAFSTSDPWYKTYYSHAGEQGILPSLNAEANTSATRLQVSLLLQKTLPASELPAINRVADDAIVDVRSGEYGADAVYEFYRAGIMTGSNKAGTFHPAANVKRSEVAAVVSRLVDASQRKHVCQQ